MFFSKKLIINGIKKLSLPSKLKDTLNSGENIILQIKSLFPIETETLWIYPNILPPIPVK